MTKFKSLIMRFGKIIPAFALVLGAASNSQACVWWFHQPKVPEQMKNKK